MKKFLAYFDGHKTQIVGALSLLIGFLTTRDIIADDTSTLLLSILTLLFGGAVIHAEKKKSDLKK